MEQKAHCAVNYPTSVHKYGSSRKTLRTQLKDSKGLWTPDCGLPVVLARTTQKWPEAAAAACCNYALRFIMATIAATKGNAGNLRLNQRVTTTKAAAQKAKENHFNYD